MPLWRPVCTDASGNLDVAPHRAMEGLGNHLRMRIHTPFITV